MISNPAQATVTIVTQHHSVQNMDRRGQKPPVFPNNNKWLNWCDWPLLPQPYFTPTTVTKVWLGRWSTVLLASLPH